jgi:hypothetical protein
LSLHKSPPPIQSRLTLKVVPTTAGVVYPILIRKLTVKVTFSWAVRCLAAIVFVTNGSTLAILRPRIKPGAVKPFTINIATFLDSSYLLFVLGMLFFLPLIGSDNLTIYDIFF